MFDEVQCGVGRTGEFCGFKAIAPDVVPDAVAWAKGLAGGFPIGAIWARTPFADVLGPGTHASTFGGTPLACAVSLSVLDAVERLLPNVREVGRYFVEQLRKLPVKDVRGVGLMVGVELAGESRPVIVRMAERGFAGRDRGNERHSVLAGVEHDP